jgi:hypothetical protein
LSTDIVGHSDSHVGALAEVELVVSKYAVISDKGDIDGNVADSRSELIAYSPGCDNEMGDCALYLAIVSMERSG